MCLCWPARITTHQDDRWRRVLLTFGLSANAWRLTLTAGLRRVDPGTYPTDYFALTMWCRLQHGPLPSCQYALFCEQIWFWQLLG